MQDTELVDRLVNKSIEAFMVGIELYNKPTITYRIEGFSFFITNAWELMLKAYLISQHGESFIYFKDSPDRTIDLSKAIRLIYTNDKDPLRKNLEKVIDLRNTSTHYITEDYETAYAPLFQSTVINYANELEKRFGKDITQSIAQNFLTLSVNLESLNDAEIKGKYSPEMAQKFIKLKNDIVATGDIVTNSDRYSIQIEQKLYITKKPQDADFTVSVDHNADTPLTIAKELRDPGKTHKYSYNNIVTAINGRLSTKKIPFSVKTSSLPNGAAPMERNKFTTNDLKLFINFYDIKSKEAYAFAHTFGNRIEYSYSQALVDFIITEIKKDPKKVIQNIKLALQNKP
ncbi:DUF3644 domain-containing protein [Weissella cibaria]|uniref:DUF3644 domain-containing protein n=1 Tax=Weissella cibaria TaxID=137591 RepID=UPI001FA805D8|nr:DUF3644 domain-containing protein [Weissella cibaria]UNW39644.1 DUF3644 domain-containing protein [Weissella cibaria]